MLNKHFCCLKNCLDSLLLCGYGILYEAQIAISKYFLEFLTMRKYFFYFYFLIGNDFLLFSYTCPTFLPIALPCLTPPLPQSIPPIVRAHESSIRVPCLAPFPSFPVIPCPPPLWSLSVCSLFPCLWFYFAHLFC